MSKLGSFSSGNPLGSTHLGKLAAQRPELLLRTIGAVAFVLQLLTKRRDRRLYHPPDIRVRLLGMIRGQIMGRSPGVAMPSCSTTPGSGGGSSP